MIEYGWYNIYYPERGFSQQKMLIPHFLWEMSRIPGSGVSLPSYYYFTDKSPIFDAISTGVIDCNNVKTVSIVTKIPDKPYNK